MASKPIKSLCSRKSIFNTSGIRRVQKRNPKGEALWMPSNRASQWIERGKPFHPPYAFSALPRKTLWLGASAPRPPQKALCKKTNLSIPAGAPTGEALCEKSNLSIPARDPKGEALCKKTNLSIPAGDPKGEALCEKNNISLSNAERNVRHRLGRRHTEPWHSLLSPSSGRLFLSAKPPLTPNERSLAILLF